MKNAVALWGLFISLLFLSSCNNEAMTIQNVRCEYLIDPIAIESRSPLLSWQLKSDERGKSQSAYRILVASSFSLLNEENADLWDSQVVKSSQSIQITYQGTPLDSRQQVYWKVMVWDEDGVSTKWSNVSTWSMGLLTADDWTAKWIGMIEDQYPDSTLTHPAPFFRKEFAVDKKIKEAKVYVCGLGFYELYLNGEKVGDQVLAPAVTNYDKRSLQRIIYHYDDQSTQRVLYNTFDVTALLQKGDNAVGAILGNGWYNQRGRTIEGCMWYNTPRLLMQLEIEYSDGTKELVQTDNSWKCTTGPILHDAIFTGETYNAGLELGDWSEKKYDDSSWQQALLVRAPTGDLHPQLAPYDKITRTIKPKLEKKVNDSTYLYALPEMISGWAELNVKGNAGDEVRLRFIGEEEGDFGQTDKYILKGGKTEKWEPRFTWHAFRYIEAVTSGVKLYDESLVVKVVNTDVPETGTFTCSNELFNKINQSYILTQKGNFHGSISSDCPHRERLAYTGDAQVVVESALLAFDKTQFYRKWFDDISDAQNKNTGYVPHTAPFGGGGGGPAWGSAYVIMPWAYYCYYGDTTLLEHHYDGMKHWVEYLSTRVDDGGIVVREEPNGWCLGDWCTPQGINIPEKLVNTAYYYHCTDLISKIAGVLQKDTDRLLFEESAQQIKDAFNREFFNSETNHYWEGRQGADVFPLAFGMVPEENKDAVFKALLNHLQSIDYHFDTGILATPLLLKVLSDNNRTDIAYRLMDQRSFPGFSYLLDDKYTCLWESWGGEASRNHPMFGSVVAWFYNSLAGIRFDDAKLGMKHVVIAPKATNSSLSSCSATYESLYGKICSEWEYKNNTFYLTVEIPANVTATVYVPTQYGAAVNESGKALEINNGIITQGKSEQNHVFEISSGRYYFSVSE